MRESSNLSTRTENKTIQKEITMKHTFTKIGEVKAISEFHRLANKANVLIRSFRMDRNGDSITITATDFYRN